jgi:ABC-type amino acid transport substrate-binding protein
MTEKVLTIRMSEQEHRALKLYAVLQGRSVNAVVTDLIRAELTRQVPGGVEGREEFVAELLARFGIDPDSPEHQAAADRARAELRRGGRTAQGAA